MSRLDKFLLSEGLLSFWKVKNQFKGIKCIYDHNPIWIKGNVVNWGKTV